MTPIRRQAGNIRQVFTASGRAFLIKHQGWIFDNEIDWVMRIECVSPYQRPQGC
jgi:hypothetical protein